jgi:hypothetical protein
MATPTQTKDERVFTCDAVIETAVATMLAADQHMDRVSALQLLVNRAVKKNVTNRVRPRTAVTN